MKVGDYVGQIINSWTYHNPEASMSMRRDLFGCAGPMPVGVVIGIEEDRHPSKGVLSRKVLVLGEEGHIIKFAESRLEVMEGVHVPAG